MKGLNGAAFGQGKQFGISWQSGLKRSGMKSFAPERISARQLPH
jgi:hypothetical protein